MNFTPLRDYILVRRTDADTESKGGIIIPDTAQDKPGEGVVIAAGPGKRDNNGTLHPIPVKAGDKILFYKGKGTETKIDGDTYLMLKEEHVWGVFGDDKPDWLTDALTSVRHKPGFKAVA
jgi:chaperonin GroES